MRTQTHLAVILTIATALLAPHVTVPVQAQTEPSSIANNAQTGRIAKFLSPTKLGNSALFENGGNIGLGTTNPTSKLDIRAKNALTIRGSQPFMTLRDASAGNARHVIQSVNGGLDLLGDNYLRGTNPYAFVTVDKDGKVGLGTADPVRTLQIGPSLDATFTIEPSDASPRAGFIRFGDNTGWSLVIGRSREFSTGPLNAGASGHLVTFKDNGDVTLWRGALRLADLPGNTGLDPLCVTGIQPYVVMWCAPSSLRYKTDVEPYRGGLDVVDRLQSITFTRKATGVREVGLAAEHVEAVEPLLTSRNAKGEIERVRYELLGAVFINAIKQQQEQFQHQEERLQQQQKQIEQLQSAVVRLEKVSQQLLSGR